MKRVSLSLHAVAAAVVLCLGAAAAPVPAAGSVQVVVSPVAGSAGTRLALARGSHAWLGFRLPAEPARIGRAVLRLYVVTGSRRDVTLRARVRGGRPIRVRVAGPVFAGRWLGLDVTRSLGGRRGSRRLELSTRARRGLVVAGRGARRRGLRPQLVLTPPVAAPASDALRAYVSGLLENVPGADAHRYGARDDDGLTLDCLKIVAAHGPEAHYLGVYHSPIGASFRLRLAVSDDLLDWHHEVDLDDGAAQGTIAAFGDGWVVAYEKRLADGIHIRVRSYASEDDLLAGRYDQQFTAPLTLSPSAEGTPSITSVTMGPAPGESHIALGLHYYRRDVVDREAEAVLDDFTTWHAAPAPAVDAEFAQFGIAGNIGDRDPFAIDGHAFTLYEAQKTPGDWSSWHTYLYDAEPDRLSELAVRTDGGSRAFGNPTATVVPGPSRGDVLVVTQFLFSEAAAPGEAGSLIYYRRLRLPM